MRDVAHGSLVLCCFFQNYAPQTFFFLMRGKWKKGGRKFNKTGRIYFLYAIYTFLKLAILHECNFRYTFLKYIHLKKKNSLIISVTRPVSDVSHGSLVSCLFFFSNRAPEFFFSLREEKKKELVNCLCYSGERCGPSC